MKKTIVLLSGGLDSAVLLATMANNPHVQCVTFHYGQKHAVELSYATRIARHYGRELRVMVLPKLGASALTSEDIDIPQGKKWDDPSQEATVVPNRNMVMLALAGAAAADIDYEEVAFAAHAGDRAIYPDCRESFVWPLSQAMFSACVVTISTPFIHMTKREIANLGKSLGVPFEKTYSCYVGRDVPCGKCGACIERAEALA
jgi:7-cyano-7-deazaguanine synthase